MTIKLHEAMDTCEQRRGASQTGKKRDFEDNFSGLQNNRFEKTWILSVNEPLFHPPILL